MNKNQYIEFCREIPGAAVDQPFNEDFESYIARHADTRKWFAAVLRHNERDIVDLKCEPIEADFLKSVYQGITDGYHMNKTHWITVDLDSDVPDALLKQLTRSSYDLTGKKAQKKK